MSVKTEEEFEKLKIIGRIVRKTLDQMAAAARSGMTTAELDGLGQKYLMEAGAEIVKRANVSGNEKGCGRIIFAAESCGAPLHIKNPELTTLDVRILLQQFDNLGGRGSFLELFKNQHLIPPGVIHGGLARGHADTRNDHRLHIHEIARRCRCSLGKGSLRHAGSGRDDDLAGILVDRNNRPGRECGRLHKQSESRG